MASAELLLELPSYGAVAGADRAGFVFFVGNATVVLRFGGLTILTDPNFLHRGDHVHLGYRVVYAQRLTDPAIDLNELPPIDLCILSHLHEDHFDKRVEAELDRSLPIATTPEAAEKLRAKGFTRTMGLATWQTLRVLKGGTELTVTAAPGQHTPSPLSLLPFHVLPPVNGSILSFRDLAAGGQAPPLLRLYISGDTLIHSDLHEIPRRFPGIDLALLHLGGTKVFGLLVTMDAAQGVECFRIVNPERAIPIHYNDYSRPGPPIPIYRAAEAAGIQDRMLYLEHGECFEFRVQEARGEGAKGRLVPTRTLGREEGKARVAELRRSGGTGAGAGAGAARLVQPSGGAGASSATAQASERLSLGAGAGTGGGDGDGRGLPAAAEQ
eukprot:tig00020934_g16109.t1